MGKLSPEGEGVGSVLTIGCSKWIVDYCSGVYYHDHDEGSDGPLTNRACWMERLEKGSMARRWRIIFAFQMNGKNRALVPKVSEK
jgi:hypothetical protein